MDGRKEGRKEGGMNDTREGEKEKEGLRERRRDGGMKMEGWME